ncbi:hypothetical protein CI610_00471 [invertebrate metagenome]|uniref:Uncharacterized protein n=1 Tax=invertebrate metagenome TaxID=1711999 RepID=A0A2H9TBL2_9ZZZZ
MVPSFMPAVIIRRIRYVRTDIRSAIQLIAYCYVCSNLCVLLSRIRKIRRKKYNESGKAS